MFGNAVCELMGDHVKGAGKVGEQDAIAVAEYHLLAIPERVVVAGIEVDVSIEAHPSIIDRIPAQHLAIERAGGSQAFKCACDGLVARCLTLLRPDQNSASDPGSVLTVEDAPAPVRGSGRETDAEGRPERALAPQPR